MNPENELYHFDETPEPYSDAAQQTGWVLATLLFLLHALPAIIITLMLLGSGPSRLSPLEAGIWSAMSIEAVGSVIAFIQLLRRRRWGVILATFLTALRALYSVLLMLLYGDYLEAPFVLALLLSIILLLVLLRPSLRYFLGLAAPPVWRALAFGAASGSALFFAIRHWVIASDF